MRREEGAERWRSATAPARTATSAGSGRRQSRRLAEVAARSGGVHWRSEGRTPAGAWEEAVLSGRPRSVEAERKGEERPRRTPLTRRRVRSGGARWRRTSRGRPRRRGWGRQCRRGPVRQAVQRPVGKPGDRAFGGWPQLRLASGGTVSSSSTGDSGDRRRVQLGQRVLQPWRMLMSSFVELDHMSSSMTLTPLSSALMMGT
jgi:hypothetical protein